MGRFPLTTSSGITSTASDRIHGNIIRQLATQQLPQDDAVRVHVGGQAVSTLGSFLREPPLGEPKTQDLGGHPTGIDESGVVFSSRRFLDSSSEQPSRESKITDLGNDLWEF